MEPARVAVLVGTKGRGSNMASLVEAGRRGVYPGQVELVVGAAESDALARAHELGVATVVVAKSPTYASDLLAALNAHNVTDVCLAGYLWLLPIEVLRAFPSRVYNIHPALLPKFGGKGMYGMNVHMAVVAAGETESGCTVHYVTEHYDEGGVILQKSCPVQPGDTAEDVAARVLELELAAYPEALAQVLDGRHRQAP